MSIDDLEPFPADQPMPAAMVASAMTVTGLSPLMGVLTIQTEDGPLYITMGRAAAAGLSSGLIDFLAIEPADYPDETQAGRN